LGGGVVAAGWSPGTPVLEIGAGIGLVGLAALSCGLKVTFSDYDPPAVALALRNARDNGLTDAEGMHLDWRQPPPLRFPVILGCDVIYEVRNHAPILDLLGRMLNGRPDPDDYSDSDEQPDESECGTHDALLTVSWNITESRDIRSRNHVIMDHE
jgi:hypothetical protein